LLIKYREFKEAVAESGVFLPYNYVLRTLLAGEKISRLSHGRITEETSFDYRRQNLIEDIISTRKPYHLVSVTSDNLPEGWLSFNEVVFDLANQAKESLAFYFPYYDLKAATYFKDLGNLKIKKTVTVYPSETQYDKDSAKKALLEFEKAGFQCQYSQRGNHAKAYLFDRKAAVIGSFNFTSRGVYENNELGTLFFGDNVRVLEKFIEDRIYG